MLHPTLTERPGVLRQTPEPKWQPPELLEVPEWQNPPAYLPPAPAMMVREQLDPAKHWARASAR
jgi:hypothetical protein